MCDHVCFDEVKFYMLHVVLIQDTKKRRQLPYPSGRVCRRAAVFPRAPVIMSRRGNPTRQIELRQRAEDEAGRYTTVTAEHHRLKLRCEWENSSSKLMKNTELFHAMDRAQARRDDVLAIRRQRLADLLAREREEHEAMLQNLVVTDDQRRERLMQKARDLRVQREELRQAQAEAKRDELFRSQSSLVRDAESKIKVLSVADQRRQQIVDCQRIKEDQAAEDRFFAEQAMALQQQQAQRAQRDLETLHQRAAGMRQDLGVQSEQDSIRREKARERERIEEQKVLESIQAGLQAEAAAEQARRQKQRAIADETRQLNDVIKSQKEIEAAKHRQAETAELDALLAKIKEDERTEQDRKRKAREDAADHIKFVEAQMSAQAASETAIDKLWQEESDRQWARREQVWVQNEQQRQQLMRQVYETRKAQIEELRRKDEAAEDQRKRDHASATAESVSSVSHGIEGKLARRQQALKNQDYLAQQVERKQTIRDRELQSKRSELTTSQAEEAAYQAKIQAELAKLEAAKPPAYQNVKLSSQRRGLM